MRVIVTGAFGWTAESILEALASAGHEVKTFDLPVRASKFRYRHLVSEVISGDVANAADINRAVQDTDWIVHLAIADQKADYQSSDVPFSVNVKGTYNVFEAARLHGLSKIVVMSSAPVHLPFGTDKQTDAHSDWKSSSGDDHLYDLTKRLQETIAMDLCDTFAMNAVVLRAGHIVDGRKQVDPRGRPLSEVDYCRGGWVCRYDLADTCLKALELRRPGYSTYSAIGSEQARKPFDIDRTERELGVSFKPRFEQYGPTAGVRPRPT